MILSTLDTIVVQMHALCECKRQRASTSFTCGVLDAVVRNKLQIEQSALWLYVLT